MMSIQPIDAEHALLMALVIDFEKLRHMEGIQHTRSYIEHNECGLAYDDLVFAIQNNMYEPTSSAFELIKWAGTNMGIQYPNLSH